MTLPIAEQKKRKALLEQGLKCCSKCGQTKSIADFNKRKTASDGFRSQCKSCEIEQHREYRSDPKNREHDRLTSLAWKQQNIEHVRAYARAWQREHRELSIRRCKAWHAIHKESENAKARERMHVWVQENKIRHRTNRRHYRARKANAEGTHTSDQWKQLKEFFKTCPCCGKRKKLTLDHIVPLAWGGKNSLDNLQALCKICNSEKGDRYAADYRPRKVRRRAFLEVNG